MVPSAGTATVRIPQIALFRSTCFSWHHAMWFTVTSAGPPPQLGTLPIPFHNVQERERSFYRSWCRLWSCGMWVRNRAFPRGKGPAHLSVPHISFRWTWAPRDKHDSLHSAAAPSARKWPGGGSLPRGHKVVFIWDCFDPIFLNRPPLPGGSERLRVEHGHGKDKWAGESVPQRLSLCPALFLFFFF